jgi:hypothetical protein
MNIKEVRVTGTVPPFFGQGLMKGLTKAEDGAMSDAVAAKMWRWFGQPLTEMKIEYNTENFMSASRYPFTITGESSSAYWHIEDLLYVMVKAGAIIETAKARDTEDGDGSWFQLEAKKYAR